MRDRALWWWSRGKGDAMCCDSMVCASCSRPVVQAACPVCRAARAQFHGQPVSLTTLVLALAALLALGLLLAGHL